jgi:SnoaL-like protein
MRPGSAILLAALLFASRLTAAAPAPAATPTPSPGADESAIRAVVADYVGLYKAGTLERWKALFHPSLTVADPRADGSIRVRGLEEFYGGQKSGFESGRTQGERLENIRVEAGRKIARVTADYIYTGEGKDSRGKLGLHLVEGSAGWRIVAIVYSYDQP